MSARKRTAIAMLALILIAMGVIVFIAMKKGNTLATDSFTGNDGLENIASIPLFNETPVTDLGIAADAIGYHDFSPNGRYFFFTALVVASAHSFSKTLLLDRTDGSITELSGLPIRDFDSDIILPLINTDSNVILHALETGTDQTAPIGADDLVFSSNLSPDGKTFVLNTKSGIRLIDVAANTITPISSEQYDGAYAWTGDGNRILGFKQTGQNLGEAGFGRQLGYWNTDQTFEPATAFVPNNIQSVSWIKQDEIARITTGFDDGSHDYIMNMHTNKIVDVGDTSAALMGGNTVDADQHLFASLGVIPTGQADYTQLHIQLYKDIALLHDLQLSDGNQRENLHIIDENTLVYLRKTIQQDPYTVTATEIVRLNLKDATETAIYALPENARTYSDLSITPDHKNWIINVGNSFVSGTLSK